MEWSKPCPPRAVTAMSCWRSLLLLFLVSCALVEAQICGPRDTVESECPGKTTKCKRCKEDKDTEISQSL